MLIKFIKIRAFTPSCKYFPICCTAPHERCSAAYPHTCLIVTRVDVGWSPARRHHDRARWFDGSSTNAPRHSQAPKECRKKPTSEARSVPPTREMKPEWNQSEKRVWQFCTRIASLKSSVSVKSLSRICHVLSMKGAGAHLSAISLVRASLLSAWADWLLGESYGRPEMLSRVSCSKTTEDDSRDYSIK